MWTPYARAELQRALEVDETADEVTRAWATFVIHNMGTNGMRIRSVGRWGRAFVPSGGMSDTTNKWIMRLSMLDAWRWRLMRVQIDNRDALEVIKYWDTPETVFYIDPPYHLDTRKTKSVYAVEQDHAHHEKLVETILKCQGAVVLSGYVHPVYKPLENAGWEKINFQTSCHTAVRWRGSGLQGKGSATAKVPRVETVWRNPAAVRMTTSPTHLKTHRPDSLDSLDKPLQLTLDDG
jgi:DNA adenine methylase